MAGFLNGVRAEIAKLEKQLQSDLRYRKLQLLQRLLAVYADNRVLEGGSDESMVGSGRPPASAAAEIESVVQDVLADKLAPTPTREIYELLQERAIPVGGARPTNALSAILSKSPLFESHGRSGWTLVNQNGHGLTGVGDATIIPTVSPAPNEHRLDQPVEHPAEGREAVPGGGT